MWNVPIRKQLLPVGLFTSPLCFRLPIRFGGHLCAARSVNKSQAAETEGRRNGPNAKRPNVVMPLLTISTDVAAILYSIARSWLVWRRQKRENSLALPWLFSSSRTKKKELSSYLLLP